MDRYRRALERIKAFPDGLLTPIPAWQVVEQMAAIAAEALGAKHVEFPPLRRACRLQVKEALEFIATIGGDPSPPV